MMSMESKWTLDSLRVSQFESKYKTKAPPTIGMHTQVGYYSSDQHRSFKPDDSELKYLQLPPRIDSVRFDLNIAHQYAIRRPLNTKPNLEPILRWILLNKAQFYNRIPQSSPQFVCSRGVLTHIMFSPYDHYQEGWIILATRYRGNIYLGRLPTEKEILRESSATERDKLMSSWGYKFEQYVTSDSPTGRPEDPSVPVNEMREFQCMVRTSVDGIPILVSAEVDAFRPQYSPRQGQTNCYVELKTSRLVGHFGHERSLKGKMVKWWAQSFILGVPSIYCGFRDEGGIVHSIKEFKTADIPAYCAGYWNATVCLHFLKQFLELVNRYVVQDDPSVVYKFECLAGRPITCEKLTGHNNQYRLLPEWYTREV